MPRVTGPFGVVTPQDPDIAALTARLGLRGLHYRSFGNRPTATVAAPPPQAPLPAPEPLAAAPVDAIVPAPTPWPAAQHPVAPPASVQPLPSALPVPAPVAPAPRPMDFPLIAAALGTVATPAAPAVTDATLVFLSLRTAHAAPGR